MAQASGDGPVNALNANKRVLQCFWDLSEIKDASRVQATQSLVEDLLQDQASHAGGAKPESGSQQEQQLTKLPKQKQLEVALKSCSPLMIYSLRRLARGLGSGRAASRQGFATALAALLSTPAAGAAEAGSSMALLGLPEGMVLLDACLEMPGSSAKGGEVRDALLGRVFGLAAMVRAGLVRDAEGAAKVAIALLALANKKAFLREACTVVLLELLLGGPAGVQPGQPGGQSATPGPKKKGGKGGAAGAAGGPARWLAPEALATLLGSGPGSCEPLKAQLTPGSPEDASPEALLLALCLWPHLPAELLAKAPLPQGCKPPPAYFALHPELVTNWEEEVGPAAAGLCDPAYLSKVQPALRATTSASPRLHTLWSHLLPFLLPGFLPHKAEASAAGAAAGSAPARVPAPNSQLLSTFWSTAVEGGLLASSHERKHLGLQLFLVLLPRLPADAVPAIFSRNFCRTVSDNVGKPDTYLHAMAKRVMERLGAYLEKGEGGADAAARLQVSAMMQRLGSAEQSKGGKAAAKVAQGLMDEEGVRSFCEHHMSAFLSGGGGNAASGAGALANGKAGGKRKRGDEDEEDEDASDSEDEEEEADEASRAISRARAQAVEALVGALRLPAATDDQRLQVLRFLATHAFFAPTEAALSGAIPAAKTPKKGGKAAAAAAAPEELVAAAKAEQGGAPALSPATRLLCAQRLLACAAHVPAAAASGGQGEPAAKKAKSKGGEAAASPAQGPPAHADPSRLLPSLMAHLRSLLGSKAARLAADMPEDADASLAALQELEEALTPLASKGAGTGRARALLQLAQLLQLHVLGDPAGAPEGSLVLDLRRVAAEAAGAKLQEMEGVEVAGSDEEEEEGSKGEEDDDEDDEEGAGGKPSWPEVLLDVLLSLLSRPSAPLPSAPLRAACEALWRAACDALTPAGMQDLLRVVTAGPKGGAEGDEDEEGGLFEGDEEEDEEEEEVEVGGSDDEEGDEDEDGSEEDDEEEEMEVDATKGKGSNKKAKGSDSGSESDDDDDDDDAMDDEEAFRMDGKIAAYLRAVMDKRRGAREAAAALVALKYRAISLLEVYARKAPNSPLLLSALVPLLRALAAASKPGGDPALAARLSSVITKGLCKAKPAHDPAVMPLGSDLPAEATAALPATASKAERRAAAAARAVALKEQAGTLRDALRRASYIAGRSPDKQVAAAGAAVLATLLRAASASTSAGADAAAEAALTSLIRDWLTKKRSRLTRAGLEEVVGRAPSLWIRPSTTGPLAVLTAEAVKGARNAVKQVEALELLGTVMRSAAASATGQNGPAVQAQVLPSLKPHFPSVGAALAAAAGGLGLKPEHHANACKAAVGVVEGVRKVVPAEKKLSEALGPERISNLAKAVVTVRDLGVSPKVDAQLSRLAQAAGVAAVLASTQPDPALKAKMEKARAKLAQKQQEQQQGGDGKKGGKGEKAQGKKEGGSGKGPKQQQKQAGGNKPQKSPQQKQQQAGKKRPADGGQGGPKGKGGAAAGAPGGSAEKKPKVNAGGNKGGKPKGAPSKPGQQSGKGGKKGPGKQ